MFTLFTIPKSFRGHSAVIQTNAIASWRALGADVEIILFGNDEGTDAAASAFQCVHVPSIDVSGYGTPLLSSAFSQAQAMSNWPILVYVNADIIFTSDLVSSLRILERLPAFLACGQRLDVWVEERVEFGKGVSVQSWFETIRGRGQPHTPSGSDYFVFRKGSISVPPFSVGRPGWDNWLIFAAKHSGMMVIDATGAITAIHQNHDYSHSKFGTRSRVRGPEYYANVKLAQGYSRMLDLRCADNLLTADGVVRAPLWRQARAQVLAAGPTRFLLGAKRRLQDALSTA
jgi:hypothetical protein